MARDQRQTAADHPRTATDTADGDAAVAAINDDKAAVSDYHSTVNGVSVVADSRGRPRAHRNPHRHSCLSVLALTDTGFHMTDKRRSKHYLFS